MNGRTTPPPLPRRPRIAPPFLWLLLGFVGLVIVIVSIRPLEDWRGQRAWKRCKADLEARGEALDWSAFIPGPVPDEQNIFQAPKMAEWFVGRATNELMTLLDPADFQVFVRHHETNMSRLVVADIKVVRSDATLDIENVDALLRKFGETNVFYARLHRSMTNENSSPAPPASLPVPKIDASPATANTVRSEPKIIPLVIMDEVRLTDAITNLARMAKLNYSLDPKIKFRQTRFKDRVEGPPTISMSWEAVTAEQVLTDLLAHYNLRWLSDPKTGTALVTLRDPAAPRMRGFPSLQEQLSQVIGNALDPSANAPQGFTLVARFDQIRPARIVLRSEKPVTARQIMEFLPTNSIVPVVPGAGYLHVEAGESNSFRIILDRSRIFTASEFLGWSDLLQSEFELIREALKRPSARMDGNYREPLAIPVANFKTFRLVAQTLAQRAQSYLLLGQSEKALRELTLIHDLCRSLEAKPTGRPIPLMNAMVESAGVAIYANAIGDGLRMHAWSEDQLESIQDQFVEVKLPSLLAEALRCDRASRCQILQNALAASERGRSLGGIETNLVQKIVNYSLRFRMPKGWFDQNLVTIALLGQKTIDSLDISNNVVAVESIDRWEREMKTIEAGFRPYTFFAAIMVPNFAGAFRIFARNQTMVNQAMIACGLERYRLKAGRYPTTLDELSPKFITAIPRDVIGGDAMRYRSDGTGSFLLYSIGWDATDDGGVNSLVKEKGDWVWSSPSN